MLKTIPKRQSYTYEDYANLPEGASYQLIGGQLIMMPAPIPYHQKVSMRLAFQLYEYVERKKQSGEIYHAPIDVYLEETETYQPDIIFISKEMLGIIKEEKIEGAPDLVIEILSPSTAYYDLRHKKEIYAKHGVKEYWIVDPIEKSIEVYENKNSKFMLTVTVEVEGTIKSAVISGFELKLSTIF